MEAQEKENVICQSEKERENPDFITKAKFAYYSITFQVFFALMFSFNSITSERLFAFQISNPLIALFLGCITVLLPIVVGMLPKTIKLINKFIFLAIHTLTLSYSISYISNITNPKYFLMITFMTFCLFFSLSFFLSITNEILKLSEGIIFTSVISLLLLIIFSIFTENKIGFIFIAVLWVILLGSYFIYDTLLIKGNRDMDSDDFLGIVFSFYSDYILIASSLFEIAISLNKDKEQ